MLPRNVKPPLLAFHQSRIVPSHPDIFHSERLPLTSDSANADRKICPSLSLCNSSISIMKMLMDKGNMGRAVLDLGASQPQYY
jgi:hypothetical protein